MKNIISITFFLIFMLTGCATTNVFGPQQSMAARNQQVQTGAATLRQKLVALWMVPEFDLIRDKIALDTADTTFAQLSSTDKPTAEEREAIAAWAQVKMDWNREALDWMKKVDPPEAVTISEVSMNKGIGNLLKLYHGQITYGEYNLARKKGTAEHNAAIEKVRLLYQQRTIQAQQQAAQLAQQQTQNFLLYLNAYNAQMQRVQQQHGTVNCHQMGAFWTCNY